MDRNGMNEDIDVGYVGGTGVWLGPLFLRNEAPPLLATRHPKTFLVSSDTPKSLWLVKHL